MPHRNGHPHDGCLQADSILERRLYGVAFAALFAGVCVYLWDRPADSVYLAPTFLTFLQSAPGGLNDNVPTLIHSFAFTLLIAAALVPMRRASVICAGWFTVEAALEALQHPAIASHLADALPSAVASTPALGVIPAHLGGTFDPTDIVFAGLGCTAAYTVVAAVARGRSHA